MLNIPQRYARFLGLGILSILLFFISFLVYADQAKPAVTALNANQPEFNLKQANKTFDQLNLQLSVENLNIEHLEAAITTLGNLISDAKKSITFYQKKLDELDNLIQEAQAIKSNDKTEVHAEHAKDANKAGADLVYLKQEQKNLSDKLAQCRLFTIRAQEAINTYHSALAKIKQQQVLTRGLPVWSLWSQLQKDSDKTITAAPKSIDFTSLPALSLPISTGLVILCLVLSLFIVKKLKSHPVAQRFFRVQHIGIGNSIIWFICLCFSTFGLYVVAASPIFPAWLETILIVGSIYFWALALIILFFKSKMVATVFYWYSLDAHFFRNLLIFLLTYYSVSTIGVSLSQLLSVSDFLWQFLQIIFLTCVSIVTISFFYYFCQSHRHLSFIRAHHSVLQRVVTLLFITFGMLSILGYQQMAMHLMYATITTFAVIFSLFLLIYAVQKIYLLCAYPSAIYRSIISTLGYKANHTVTEFILLKFTLQMIILGFGIYFIGQIWDYGNYYINTVYAQVFDGIHLGSFTFYPSRVVVGILVFCVLYLGFRAIATKLSRHAQFEAEEETQVAVASIVIYTGFTCALVAALLVSGIDFTGLAIVAGALSVGIGLGLQSIVNNFVSGLILLIEKPIKPGDHINIDKIEGTVKKIRIRSTQITTSAREDIIIPNSDLITRAVTNYMYTDRYLSIYCEVGVAYDSDPVLVKKLLLQAVSEHDEIIKTPRAKSSVLFQAFGDSAMIFQVWFLIKDGNKKAQVRSDVNFVIDRLFREHHIKIAHPLRDINVRLSEIPTKIADK
jgi:potassium efflux system protein